jgi:non-ribosomal peptide synthase protein (TIGR01720 family)
MRTTTALSRRIASLHPKKQALLARRLARDHGAPDALQPARNGNQEINEPQRLIAYVTVKPDQVVSTEQLRRYLNQRLPAYMVPSDIVFLDALPLTPNGKLDRNALPAPARTQDDLPAAAEPQDAVEGILAQIWADVLGLERIGLRDNFFEVGGDSILSIQIIARAHQAGLRMTPNQIFDHPTVAELAASIRTVSPPAVEPGLAAGPAPLTPIQHWFFEQPLYAPHHWNQALLLQVPADLELPVLEQAFQQLVRHHDALRARYRRTPRGWEQDIGGPEIAASVEHIDLPHVTPGRENETIEQEAGRLHASFLLERGPLLRAALFTFRSGDRNRLLIVAHHLIIDAVSWRILLEDLETLYLQLAQGNPAQLPAKTTSWQAYSTWLTSFAKSSKRLATERSYWLSATTAGSAPTPLDHTPARSDGTAADVNTMASERTVTVALDENETHDLLYQVPGHYRARVVDLLLTALVQAFAERTEDQSLLLGLEGHGREEVGDDADTDAHIDLSRTIGWFTSFFPVTLTAHQGSLDAALKSVKEQLRRIPNRGIGYGLLRYLSPDPESRRLLAALPQPQVLFNYLGQSEAVGHTSGRFQRTEGPVGPSRHPQNQRLFLLEINSQVVNRRLQVTWAYSKNLHQAKTIHQLAERHLAQLRLLITHCLSARTAGYTPSDFPLVDLDQGELDKVLEQVIDLVPPGVRGGIERNVVEDLYPLSPMQGLMLLHAVTPHHQDTLLTQMRYRLEGELDLDSLRRAWQALVDRHPALRTGFLWKHLRTPVQFVCRQVELPFVYYDLRRFSAEERQAKLETIGREDRERRFNLSTPPLMRITVVQLTDAHYELLWSSHHLILDRWCIDLVIRETLEMLEAGHGRPGGEKAPAPSFRNYIAWLQHQDQGATEQFWRRKFTRFVGPTRLAAGQADPRGQGDAPLYREIALPVPESTVAEARRFVRQHHLTLNTLLQAVWALLLGGHSGEQDVSFGITVSGRPPALAGVDSMIGSLVNNLPVRISISDVEMPAWLKSIQKQMSELREYEHSSLTRIHEWSGVARKTPLFESLLIHQARTGFRSGQAGTVSVHNLPGRVRTTYPLTVLAVEADAELSLSLIYDVRLFAPSFMSEIGQALVSTLHEIVAEPALNASPLCLMQSIHHQRSTESSAGVGPRESTVTPLRGGEAKPNAPIKPKDILENQLVKIWEMILETEPIGVQDNFFELGGHSLLAVRLFAHIEETFGTRLPATILSQAATIRELAELMRREDAASLKPVITLQASGNGRPLFYISPPGEAMLAYAYFVHHLGLDRPCFGLQPLGLNGEQGTYTRTEAMAGRFIHEIRRIQPEGPYLLTGTCFGGLVAVEVARQLQAEGQPIAFLGLLDTPFPNPTLSSKIQWHLKSLMALQPRERLDYILDRIKRRTAKIVGPFYFKRQRVLPAPLREHMVRAGVAQAANTYIPQRYQGRITLFRAEDAVGPADKDSVAWGWNQVATDGVDVHLVPGRHGSMMSEPHVHVLVEKFRASLEQLDE